MTSVSRTRLRRWILLVAATGLSVGTGCAAAATLNFPATPLFVTNAVTPNIMFMVDNSGSMRNVVVDEPFNSATDYLPGGCPSGNRASTNRTSMLYVRNSTTGGPRIYIDADNDGNLNETAELFVWGTGSGQRCFVSATVYSIALNANSSGTRTVNSLGYRFPESYLDAEYSGNYLNWYFNTTNTSVTWNAGQRVKPLSATSNVQTRIEVARNAGVEVVNQLDSRLRVGFSTYNSATSGQGGELRVQLAPLTTAQRAALTTGTGGISTLAPFGLTPLGETLANIGRHFAQGYAGDLSLHPGTAQQQSASVSSFLPADLRNATPGAVTITNPITASCQQSFAVLLTDGRPQGDRSDNGEIGSLMEDYDGDCSGSNASNCVSSPTYDRKTAQFYESAGSDYLDDVAQALFEIDLRPDFPVETGSGQQFKNNVRSYVIGFSDSLVLNDPLLQRAATQGGGAFFAAENAQDLADAFNDIVTDVIARSASFSSASLNSTSLNAGTRLFQASFSSGDWSGNLRAIPISTGAGGECPAIERGRLCPAVWDAASLLDGAASRAILTTANGAGVPFEWASLTGAQQTLLNFSYNNLNNTVAADSRGQERLNYIRGDRSQEGSGASNFRVRSTRLGDIVDSDPFFVGGPNSAFPFAGYSAFRNANANRIPMVYVGSNDGMLHGFRASGNGQGSELLAYVPSSLFGSDSNPKLARLTSKPYTHVFGVDGSPTVGDLQIGSTWFSYLIGSLRYGGQALFALNVTDPSTFSQGNASNIVKWEFTDANSGAQGRDLGYTFGQPTIAKMKNGKWAIIVGNGYNSGEADGNSSSTEQAALFIIFANGPGGDGTWAHGTEYIRIPVGPTGQDNGLGTPAVVDIDGDSLVDYVYAGDLLGNLWQFNVNAASEGSWVAGYNGNPVFTARDHIDVAQPITAEPEVGLNQLTADPDDLVVYFGTGRYLQIGDNSQIGQQNQTFYGIFVNPIANPPPSLSETMASPNLSRSDLLEQFVIAETTSGGRRVRASSRNQLDLAVHDGWYIDLYNSNGGSVSDVAAAGGLNKGERQISRPILRNSRIVFTTLIPSENPCDFGGTGFLMELDARTGGRPSEPTLDINNNLIVDSNDRIIVAGEQIAVSGIGAQGGIPSTPAILGIDPQLDVLYVSESDYDPNANPNTQISQIGRRSGGRAGRVTWREIP